jgi:hypothetical protein
VREAKPLIPTTSGDNNKPSVPRRPSVPPKRTIPLPEEDSGVDPKLQALLAKQRKWEDDEEEAEKVKSHTRVDSLTQPGAGSPRSRSPTEDEKRAKRLEKLEFDNKRKTGWKKEGEESSL